MNEDVPGALPQSSRTRSISGLPRSEKIGARHLERLAFVYVRQSSPQQVVRNQESRQVQYNLKGRAIELGWPVDRVEVIDEDLGKSGETTEERLGFQRLVAEVTLNHVGLILGVEMSRLARSCKDWYQLLEVCGVFGTLIGDLDGVYDPSQYNDRLLLGLKGTMSEAELHILKQRLHQGRLNKARRGELFNHVPMGYVRRPGGEVLMDPDDEVREVVRLIFRTFDEVGTLAGTLRYLVAQGIKLPMRSRSAGSEGDLEWRRASQGSLRHLLNHPMYAGVYVYGRRVRDARRKAAGRRYPGCKSISLNECEVVLPGRLPAYITWEQYQANQERLKANRTRADATGAPRRGPSLLSGLAVCGKCGARMRVSYGGRENRHLYSCARRLQEFREPFCQSLAGPPLDAFVTGEVLRALEPASLELSLQAAGEIERQRAELDNVWQKRLERARYEAERAERHYLRIEPENRMVARTLARQWEEALAAERNVKEEHARVQRNQPRLLSAEERETIRALAKDIPTLWASPITTDSERKEILRQVVDRVIVKVVGGSERVEVGIEWAGGMRTDHEIKRPVMRWELLSDWPQLKRRIGELAEQPLSREEIARRLNEEGFRSPRQRGPIGVEDVGGLLRRQGVMQRQSRCRDRSELKENEWWLPLLAEELAMPMETLYQWVYRGWVRVTRSEGSHPVLWADGAETERLRELRTIPHGQRTRHLYVRASQPDDRAHLDSTRE